MDKIKKLKLKKEIIASLNNVEMDHIKGGANIYDDHTKPCVGTVTCGCVFSNNCIKTNADCVPPSVTCLPTDPYW